MAALSSGWTEIVAAAISLASPRRASDSTAVLLDEQRSFVADASHQLRTPLTGLRLRLENLQSRVGSGEAGSQVDITVDKDGGAVRLVIADHGPGLSDQDKVRAFRRFWRGRTHEHLAPGTGLGLPIAQALARACGATLRLEDTPDGGLTAIVTFADTTIR